MQQGVTRGRNLHFLHAVDQTEHPFEPPSCCRVAVQYSGVHSFHGFVDMETNVVYLLTFILFVVIAFRVFGRVSLKVVTVAPALEH